MPSQDNENAMDGLLRRSLARDSAASRRLPRLPSFWPRISTNR